MHANNNNAVIHRISKRLCKTDKLRNTIVTFAIVLTTFMISVIFSIGISFLQNLNISMIRNHGTTSNASFQQPTDEQLSILKELDYLESAGLEINTGFVNVTSEDGQKVKIAIKYLDNDVFTKQYTPAISDIIGTYPDKDNEVMMSEKALKLLGLPDAKVGDTVELAYTSKTAATETFILSGSFRNYSYSDDEGSALILVSDAFINKLGMNTMEYRTAVLTLPSENIDAVTGDLHIDAAITDEQKLSIVITSSSSPALSTFAVIILLAMCILFSGYLLIYNIMYISVSKDVRIYGMLKTLGMTPKQIRLLIREQLYRLSTIGISIGFVLGTLVSLHAVPEAIKLMGGERSAIPADVSFNPVIFIGAALFSLLTIAISVRKPAKMAGNVSPVDALHYTGIKERKGRNYKRGTDGGKLYRMAFHNVFRDRKKAILVFISLFLGSISLLGVNGLFKSLSVDNFIKYHVPHSFEYIAGSDKGVCESVFDSAFVDTIKQIEGVETVECINTFFTSLDFDEALLHGALTQDYKESGMADMSYEQFVEYVKGASPQVYEEFSGRSGTDYGVWLIGAEDRYIEEYNKTAEKQINIDAFHLGNEVLMLGEAGSSLEEMNGKMLSLRYNSSSESYKVMLAGLLNEREYSHLCSHFIGTPPPLIVSQDFLNQISKGEYIINKIFINCADEAEAAVAEQLMELNASRINTSFTYSSRNSDRQRFISTINTFNIFCDSISIVLILIGILNFVNVMITGVNSRKKELSVLQSIGMTKKQIIKMLSYEGLYYAIISTGILLSLGNLIMLFVGSGVTSLASYATFTYPVGTLLILLLFIFAVCILVPVCVYKLQAKKAVLYRLRDV